MNSFNIISQVNLIKISMKFTCWEWYSYIINYKKS